MYLRPPFDDQGDMIQDEAEEDPDRPGTKAEQYAALFTTGGSLGVPVEELQRAWMEKWGAADRPWSDPNYSWV